MVDGCQYIGNGTVITTGAVVSKNISNYSVWGGVPAKCIKMRFDGSSIKRINKIAWWNNDLPELVSNLPYFEFEVNEQMHSKLSKALEK